jgi:hypothetical protein
MTTISFWQSNYHLERHPEKYTSIQHLKTKSYIIVGFISLRSYIYADVHSEGGGQRTGEKPLVLSARVLFLKGLFHSLLGLLPLRGLFKGVVGDDTLQALHLQGVTSGHEVVVVDDLDERLDLGALGHLGLAHAASDLGGVAVDPGDQSMAEGVSLAAVVHHCSEGK